MVPNDQPPTQAVIQKELAEKVGDLGWCIISDKGRAYLEGELNASELEDPDDDDG